jgi:hypothetical protein
MGYRHLFCSCHWHHAEAPDQDMGSEAYACENLQAHIVGSIHEWTDVGTYFTKDFSATQD